MYGTKALLLTSGQETAASVLGVHLHCESGLTVVALTRAELESRGTRNHCAKITWQPVSAVPHKCP